MASRNGAGPAPAIADSESRKVVLAGELDTEPSKPTKNEAQASWRDLIKIHPAAELFPMMSEPAP